MPRSIASAVVLVDLANDYGIDPDALLDGTGIAPETLADPTAEITARHEIELAKNLVRRLGHVPGLGLRAGLRYRVSTHGIWGFAGATSPTFGEAMTVIAAYPELSYSFSRLTLETRTGAISLVFDDHDVPEEIRLFNAERDWSILITSARGHLPEAIAFTDVSFAWQRPDHADLYRELLGIEPRFDAPRTELRIPAALLHLPMPKANPETATIFTQQAAQLLHRRRERLGTAGAVRDELIRTRRFTTDQADAARALSVSVRTLRRRLASEGTSYREITAETARMLAEELLSSGLTVADVAHRLGYSGAPSLTDAFRTWTGTTPGEFARRSRPY